MFVLLENVVSFFTDWQAFADTSVDVRCRVFNRTEQWKLRRDRRLHSRLYQPANLRKCSLYPGGHCQPSTTQCRFYTTRVRNMVFFNDRMEIECLIHLIRSYVVDFCSSLSRVLLSSGSVQHGHTVHILAAISAVWRHHVQIPHHSIPGEFLGAPNWDCFCRHRKGNFAEKCAYMYETGLFLRQDMFVMTSSICIFRGLFKPRRPDKLYDLKPTPLRRCSGRDDNS